MDVTDTSQFSCPHCRNREYSACGICGDNNPARQEGWEQNMQLRSAVQITILHWEQKMWILPIHQKRAVFWDLLILKWHENTKGRKPFWCLIMRNMVDFQTWNYLTHTHTRERKREKEKIFETNLEWNEKTSYYSRHQLMDHIYFVSIWNGRGILIIFLTKHIKKYSLENTANML